MIISFLIQEMLRQILNDEPVGVAGLDKIIGKNNIAIRKDHREFIINFGNCNKLLNNGFSNFTFGNFKDYYLDTNLFDTDKVPSHTIYLGSDFADELLCIDNITGEIYTYYSEEKDLYYYKNLSSLLFYCLIHSEYMHKFFGKVSCNVNIDDINLFFREKYKYRIDDIYIRYQNYFFIENKIYETDENFSMANVYEGGVLDYYK